MSDYVHYGHRSWWDGSVNTLCGLKFSGKQEQQENSWTTSATCPRCKVAAKNR